MQGSIVIIIVSFDTSLSSIILLAAHCSLILTVVIIVGWSVGWTVDADKKYSR